MRTTHLAGRTYSGFQFTSSSGAFIGYRGPESDAHQDVPAVIADILTELTVDQVADVIRSAQTIYRAKLADRKQYLIREIGLPEPSPEFTEPPKELEDQASQAAYHQLVEAEYSYANQYRHAQTTLDSWQRAQDAWMTEMTDRNRAILRQAKTSHDRALDEARHAFARLQAARTNYDSVVAVGEEDDDGEH
ncbi:hypothetical protein CF166_11125 [Amycolatopsis sp. KNN50.9b]|nr:hypothetical protein CF166_11125 [Amycolatopsis sp. KNN50.9b]